MFTYKLFELIYDTDKGRNFYLHFSLNSYSILKELSKIIKQEY